MSPDLDTLKAAYLASLEGPHRYQERSRLGRVWAFFEAQDLPQGALVEGRHLRSFLASLPERYAPSTRAGHLVTARRWLRFCHHRGILTFNDTLLRDGLEERHRALRVPSGSCGPDWSQVLRDYLDHRATRVTRSTLRAQYGQLLLFLEFCAREKTAPHELCAGQMDDWVGELTNRLLPSAVAHFVRAVRSFFDWCQRRGLILAAPDLAGVAVVYRLPRSGPSCDQVEQLLELCDLEDPEGLRDRAFFEVAYGCGLRLGELLRLVLSDIDLAERLLVVRCSKNGEGRMVPLLAPVGQALSAYLERGRSLLLAQRRRHGRPAPGSSLWIARGGRLSAAVVRRRLRELYAPRLGFHPTFRGLRHAFATHLLENGAPLPVIRLLLGHRALASTVIYTRVRPTELSRAHRRHHPRG